MNDRESRLQRLDDLLADRATQGLAGPDALELEALRREYPEADVAHWERAAAVLDLALEDDVEPMPAALREKLRRDAAGWLAARQGLALAPSQPRPRAKLSRWLAAATLLSAAASLVFGVLALWPQSPAGVDPAARRVALLAEAPDVVVLPWKANPAGITGDVVWSTQRQEGYLRIAGLGANDPAQTQYQVWVFDGKRQGLNAVSGGVFDVKSTGEVIVPIDPGVQVFQPTLVAVTTEPPGGVVQHDPQLDPQRYTVILAAPVGP